MSKKGGKCKSARCVKKLAATGGRLYLLRKFYFDFVKVIFRLLAEVKVILSAMCQRHTSRRKVHRFCRQAKQRSNAFLYQTP